MAIFDLTDDSYSDIIHCINQTVNANRCRANEMRDKGLDKLATPFDEQAARLARLKGRLENIYEDFTENY